MAYFPVPEGRGGILTILHGRADILQLSVKMNGVYSVKQPALLNELQI